MQQSGATFGSIRYQLLRTLHKLLRDEPGTETDLPVEAAVAVAPREREELFDTLKEQVGDDEVPPFTLETTLTPDELTDPADLEPLPHRRGQASPASEGPASSSARPHLEEPPTKRAATGTTAEEISNAVSSLDLALMPPPRRDPKGMPVFDDKGKECAHYRRRSPALNVVSWSASMPPTATSSYADAQVLLRNWLGLRPGLLESLETIEMRPYSWSSGQGDNDELLSTLHAWGVYFYCPLKEWVPKPRADIDVVGLRSSKYHRELARVIHASSMYSVHRTTLRGLEPGPLPGKGGLFGVYVFQPSGYSRAVSSSGYAVYSLIGGSCLASPRYELAAELYRAGEEGVGKISAKEGQLCMKPGMYYLRGVWFHVLTRNDVSRGPPTWCSWDDWIPEHELPVE